MGTTKICLPVPWSRAFGAEGEFDRITRFTELIYLRCGAGKNIFFTTTMS